MVHVSNEDTVVATIRDTICMGPKKTGYITLSPFALVSTVFSAVEEDFRYAASSIELVIQNSTGATIILNQHLNKTLGEIGVAFDHNIRNTVVINSLRTKATIFVVKDPPEDDLLLGASASPTAGTMPCTSSDPQLSIEYPSSQDTTCNYVGLVNQAMTCYLNSLLQALFMTPEFRNALYNWKFDGINEDNSIPYKLQRLFLNLQTSSRSSIETTELTRSFGWDLSEAWQQHDIQELCRVMFDALEQKFKDTRQANLINDLYEGKMLDYVKCLECGTEKSREDTFLDIPLPVRPFGSNIPYNSIEEAINAFVQPETLEGNNQYFCEKCNKKCNAHKGFKFIKFPYLLTLHLKRFDFDYATMHRIKLNDKVIFPEMLKLNSFITPENCNGKYDSREEVVVKCDDCSTTDSGSALEDESCHFNDVTTVSGNEDNCQNDDEGIDVSLCNHFQDNEKNHGKDPAGPYNYELYSIMIHSGSASGGHYYAYIKDFEKNQWFCFNDQTVSRITEEDIRKTYGGGPLRSYYSGAYSSSTNAYMLMYRQIDKERNCSYMKVDEFPVHIKRLLHEMREQEEFESTSKVRENDILTKISVYCFHPVHNQLVVENLNIRTGMTLGEATKMAYRGMHLEGVVDIEDCRLVAYSKAQDWIGCSFEESSLIFCDILGTVSYGDWKLEIKEPGTEFQVYKPRGANMKLFYINIESDDIEGPYTIYVNPGETVSDVKNKISKILSMQCSCIELVQKFYNNDLLYLDNDKLPMQFDPNYYGHKLYVAHSLDKDRNKEFHMSKLKKLIDIFINVLSIEVFLPKTDSNTLESLSIPSLDMNQNLDKNDLGSGDRLRISPQPHLGIILEGFGDHSNSEDSSLSESDRTLVGDAPGETSALLSSSSNSPADQHMASPSDPTEDTYNHEVFGNASEEMNWDDDAITDISRLPNDYFKVVARIINYNFVDSYKPCNVLVDRRMTLLKFKKNLEPILGVPMEYLKVFKVNTYETEWTKLNDTLDCVNDKEKFIVKLGRVLKPNEYAGKVFLLRFDNTETQILLFEWIISQGQTVEHVKKEMLLTAKKLHSLDIDFGKCQLRAKEWTVSPGKVYIDDQKFCDDIPLDKCWEMYLQDVGEGDKVTNINQLSVLVRRWCPLALTLSHYQEVVLNTRNLDELKWKLSEESGIPKEFIDIAAPPWIYVYIPDILEIQDNLEWNPNRLLLERPFQVCTDGKIFLYRDSREKLKEITSDDRKQISRKEYIRLGNSLPKSTYSSRKEQALKIYLDKPPKNTDDNCGD